MNRRFNKVNYEIEPNNLSAQFYINRIDAYDANFPEFRKPAEIGSFVSDKRFESLKKKENQDETANNYGVKYLVLPKTFPSCNFDLNIGQSEFVEHIPHQNGIDAILKWILKNKSKFQSSNESLNNGLNTDFICWRGLLTKLLASPYERQNDWMFTVVYHKNTWYLCELETNKQEKERLNASDTTKKFTYWGHKFETYVTADEENGKPEYASEAPDPEDNYSTVVRTRLLSHSLVYAAEIDCCFKSEHNSLQNYCEIKTSRGTCLNDLNFKWNLKFMKWWLQSFLVDTKTLLIGMRDDFGVVKSLTKCDLGTIYKNAQNWNPSVCFNFLKEFLDFLKLYCREQNCCYIFERLTASSVINCRKSFDNKKYYFLRDWYLSEI